MSPAPPGPRPPRAGVPPVLKYSAAGLAIVAVVVAIVFLLNRGSQVRLDGQIVKVRTLKTGDADPDLNVTASSLAIIECRLRNPAGVSFLVKSVKVTVTDANGATVESDITAETDLKRVLDYYPQAGPLYNPTLKARDRIASGESVDRTVAASVRIPESALQSRQALTIEIQEADGAVVTLTEKR